jgi:tetratricopeptide (TPR) repeat protein
MAVFKCKMCGGDLVFEQGSTVCECEYCGSKQTLPKFDDDKKATLYERADHYRRSNEYDKAISIYEQILDEDTTDAEAYWSLVLCRYGIEYVEDPQTHKRIPTVNRAQYTSVLADEDYKSALKYADIYQKTIYEDEAKAIDDIQKGILAISQKEEPFDVFICYKETDANGRRTQDSVLANDLYHQLTNEGFKVFFSRITLEDKLGTAYEPYIFAALNSAKVMVVIGTKPEYFNAVWVKNEWSRYLALVKNSNGKKMLIPAYRDMDPYDLPEEFSHLQAQDMSKLGFMQDLIRGIKKILEADAPKQTVKETVIVNNAVNSNTAPLLERAFMFLEDGKWQDANTYCEKVLDLDPKNADAYLGKLMAELKVRKRERLADCAEPFDGNDNFNKVIRFGSEKLQNEIHGYITHIKERNENARLEGIYSRAVNGKNSAKSEDAYKSAAQLFDSIEKYKDSADLAKKCREKAEICRKEDILNTAKGKMTGDETEPYKEAISLFGTIPGWRDADEQKEACERKIEEINAAEEAAREKQRIAAKKQKIKRTIACVSVLAAACACVAVILQVTQVIIPGKNYNNAVKLMEDGSYDEAIAAFTELENYKDSANKIEECNELIKETAYNNAVKLMENGNYDEAISAFTELGNYKDSADKIEACGSAKYGEETWNKIKEINVGDTYTFGSYEQDNDTSNGKEEIEWQILEKQDNKILIISKYALDCQKYNIKHTDVTWETCTLRSWLNSTFINNAFSEAEQSMIADTKVTADKNPNYSTNPGNDTTDKIFLLSINEVNKYLTTDELRKCVPTAYAIEQGAYTSDNYTSGGKATCWWWLRSPGSSQLDASNVSTDGSVDFGGIFVGYSGDCVRPALWINL